MQTANISDGSAKKAAGKDLLSANLQALCYLS